ncbi:hypothetical protein [Mameliella sp.]|uniref:hypothetical protein n=1 Tax=Mameliella sp. TaxID=1924940 RepID=UPI003B50189D
MKASRDELKIRIEPILEQHLGLDEVPGSARSMLVDFFLSAIMAAKENRIGRPLEAEKNKADKQLRNIAHLLKKVETALWGLNPLARELLARDHDGLLDLSNGEFEEFVWAGTKLGSSNVADDFSRLCTALRQSLERTSSELEGRLQSFGRGAPPKDGAFAVAQCCALAFREYVAEPAHPTWNDYAHTTEGRFYSFVKTIFEAGEVDASPEEYAKQAIDSMRRNNSEKN